MTATASLCQRCGFEVRALITLIDLKLVPTLQWNGLTLRSALTYG